MNTVENHVRREISGLPDVRGAAALGSRYPILGLTRTQSGWERIVFKGEANIAWVARPGSGKSRAGAIPNLGSYAGSTVTIDLNNELAAATALWQAAVLGHDVAIFGPAGFIDSKALRIGEIPNIRLGCFNPIDTIRASPTPLVTALRLAQALIPADSKDPIWSNGARLKVASYAKFVATSPYLDEAELPRNMATLWNFLSNPYAEKEVLPIMRESDDSVIAQQAFLYSRIYEEGGEDNREVQGYNSHVITNLAPTFGEPSVLETMTESNFPFIEMNRRPMSAYFCLPGYFSAAEPNYLRLNLGGFFEETERAGRRDPSAAQPPILGIFDEFAGLKHFPLGVDAMARLRGFGFKCIFFCQSYSQLEQIYGSGWRQLCGTADCTVFSGGTSDSMTAREVSEMCGVETIVIPGDSQSSKPGDGGTLSHHVDSRHVFTPDEVMRLPVGESIIKQVGKNPMRERLFHPSLKDDFPEYVAFQQHIKEGWDVIDAANVAKQGLTERRNVVRPVPPPVMQSAPAKASNTSFFGMFDKGLAKLIGQDTE